MFDLLKKKLGNFAQKVKRKAEKKELETASWAEGHEPKPVEEKEAAAEEKQAEEPAFEEKEAERGQGASEETAFEEPVREETAGEEKATEAERLAVEESVAEEAPREEEKQAEELAGEPEEPKPAGTAGKPEEAEPSEEPEGAKPLEEGEAPETAKLPEAEEPVLGKAEEKRELKPKVSLRGKLKGIVRGKVKLNETDLRELLDELELALLEADVEQTTSEEICREIKERLLQKEIGRGEKVEEAVKKEIKEILLKIMQTERLDLLKEVKEKKEKPFKILFLGPNGAGKTTSIAKLTHLLQGKGMKVIWAAADTFRAASIEQLEKHAQKLGVRVVKHQYGADPAAVAFDAVKAAQSRGIDVVLIDSAGRQETNKNLMRELEKIVRVAQPDLRLYVAEAFTGQALLQQASEYEKEVGIDGFILSKIDCDAKGGTTISLLYKLRKPILFVGTGQEYGDLQEFEPEFVLGKIL